VGFESRVFCSGGGRDDHYATPPGLILQNISLAKDFLFDRAIFQAIFESTYKALFCPNPSGHAGVYFA
jgi:hypothetical protein